MSVRTTPQSVKDLVRHGLAPSAGSAGAIDSGGRAWEGAAEGPSHASYVPGRGHAE